MSEALALEAKDMDFVRGTGMTEHLESRINLACPEYGARSGKGRGCYPKCGTKIEKAVARAGVAQSEDTNAE